MRPIFARLLERVARAVAGAAANLREEAEAEPERDLPPGHPTVTLSPAARGMLEREQPQPPPAPPEGPPAGSAQARVMKARAGSGSS